MEKKENVHKDHRKRLREKAVKNGIECLQPHEILELLLFNAYRQRDTNVIAHRLLKKYGTVYGVLEAEVESLTEVQDVGYNTAVFLNLQSHIQRYCMNEKFAQVKKMSLTPQNIGEYAQHLFLGYTDEVFYMISLNSDCEIITSDLITKGTVNSVAVYSREIVKKAIETKAKYVIFAHNHPSGLLAPSEDDIKTTKVLADALKYINVRVVDHVIVARGEYISLVADYNIFEDL